jgi:hypothetical protein
MTYLLITIFIIFFIELIFSPRIDKLISGEYILWYSSKGARKYFIFKKG